MPDKNTPADDGEYYKKMRSYFDEEPSDIEKPSKRQKGRTSSNAPKYQKHVATTDNAILDKFNITKGEFDELIKFRKDNLAQNNMLVFFVGVLLTPITLLGALLGYIRAHNRFFKPKNYRTDLWPLRPISRFAMFLGAIVIWIVLFALILAALPIIKIESDTKYVVIAYLTFNFTVSAMAFGTFKLWQRGINNAILESTRFGSARFANDDELYTKTKKNGFYIGQGHLFDNKGHILTVAGTRGGKGTNIIIPNLLGAGNMACSWVVIDPKGENAAITANYQRKSGQNVVILNPWDLLAENIGTSQSYNPLDMLVDKTSPHLVDDVGMLAEMVVPIEPGSKDRFWSDSARTVVTGLIMHMITSQKKENITFATLWKWARLYGDDWDKLIQEMGISDDPINGDIVKNAANEILKLSAAGDDTFGGIISNVLQATDFLKSPALQKSLESGFDPKELADGKTTVYIVIPADKLNSHARWLRLVTTSMLRAVIRKPKERVCFLLDEFAALGYLPEIEIALSTYAGYNVTVWPILQSLGQLNSLYRDNWESFIANCTVRQYFTINDNFSAQYISTAMGQTSHTIVTKTRLGVKDAEATKRDLITPDELRRSSGKKIFMFIDDLPPTYIDKLPYYQMAYEIRNRADKNPYI